MVYSHDIHESFHEIRVFFPIRFPGVPLPGQRLALSTDLGG